MALAVKRMDYVASLRGKRSEVWDDLERLRTVRRDLDERIGVRETQLRNLDELLALEGEGEGDNGASPPSGPSTFMDVAVQELRQAPSGLHYQDLLAKVRERGVHVPGRDPAANLITHLSRDDRVVRIGRGTYASVGSAVPVRPARRRRIVRKPVKGT